MKIRVLGAAGSEGLGQRPTAFLVDDTVLIDAGTVSGALTVPQQLRIEHALISHAHLDHTGGLAFLAETLACCEARRPVTVSSLEPVMRDIGHTIFNNHLWPDFASIPCPDAPVVEYRALEPDVEHRVGHLKVRAVPVEHTVPAAGFGIHNGTSGLIYSGDTEPTAALRHLAHRLDGIGAVILECAFPNRMTWLARIAKHFTPELIKRELDSLPPGVPIWVFHVKPQFRDETLAELSEVDPDRLVVLEQDRTYTL